jgi:hypothetical protein
MTDRLAPLLAPGQPVLRCLKVMKSMNKPDA